VHGPYGPLWFQTLALIAVTAVLSDTRGTLLVGALGTAGYIAGTLWHGAPLAPGGSNRYLAEAHGIVANALLFRIVIEGLAGFTLRLRTFEQPECSARPLRVPNLAAPAQANGTEPAVRHRRRRPPSRLTSRQLEVVVLLRDGLHQYEIAECLSISARQVERLLTEARARVGARNTHELVALAVREGLVPQPP
jgi:DNA-binding CsgD family transcriptional regulator